MDALSLHIKYRPLRIGWCVRHDDFDALRGALRATHILWGGRYNPVIPVDDTALAKDLVECFRADILYPSSDDKLVHDFIAGFPYLRTPIHHGGIVVNDPSSRPFTTVLDLYHPVRRLRESQAGNVSGPPLLATLYSWDADDPLADVFLATFGAFPPQDEIGINFADFVKSQLTASEAGLRKDQPVPVDAFDHVYPSKITRHLLEGSPVGGWWRRDPGFYVGDCTQYDDVVNYWNLRAADLELLFFDRNHSHRLSGLRDAWRDRLEQALSGQDPFESRIAIWSRTRDVELDPQAFGGNTVRRGAEPTIWDGQNVRVPQMGFKEHSALAMLTRDDQAKVAFQLGNKPFSEDSRFMNQHVVVSVHPLTDIWDDQMTLRPPYVPELNEHYGRKGFYRPDSVRVEPGGLGVITTVTDHDLTLNALDVRDLVITMFGRFGIEARPSQPGRIGARLIQQMGGLQGCRVFKIAGVRRLIEKYGPDKRFKRNAALQLIGPGFTKYEDLCIEYAPTRPKLKPQHAFLYLVDKGVFRVGLEFRCPRCELTFWRILDEVKSQAACEYCAAAFDVTTQLWERDWAYRRSGLFGREDQQQGSIAVAVALQQLDTNLSLGSGMLWTTNMKLSGNAASIDECETDLVVVMPIYEERVQLVLGECKTRRKIEEEDVLKLAKVADALPKRRFETFLLFAKLAPFTPQEIAVCRKAQGTDQPRVILLSDRELEPYFTYEWAQKEFIIRRHGAGLRDMAAATIDIYFEPKPKSPT